jgi:hypothetical protein
VNTKFKTKLQLMHILFQNETSEPIKETINRSFKSKNVKLTLEIRSLHLHYNVIQQKPILFKTFNKLLPHLDTLRI